MGIRCRAASLGSPTRGRRASKGKVDADNIVAGIHCASSRNSRINPTRQGSDHTHVNGPGVDEAWPLERLGPEPPA